MRLKTLASSSRIIVGATCLAFTLRIWFISTARVDHPIRGDAREYLAYAENLVRHHVFSMATGSMPVIADGYRDPGYPAFLAPFLMLFPDLELRWRAVQVAQALLGTLAVTTWLLVAKRWFKPAWLALAGMLLAVWPHSITSPAYLLSETLVGCLVGAGIAAVTKGLSDHRRAHVALGGIMFGAAGVTNAVVAPFLPLMAIAGLFMYPSRRPDWYAMLLASLLLPGCWALRNLTLDEGPGAGQRATINFVQGSWPTYHAAWQGARSHALSALVANQLIDADLAVAMRDRGAGIERIARRIRDEPATYAFWYASKPALLWDWRMRIAAGPIYVFPTLDSPLESSRIASGAVDLFEWLNPWLSLFALAGCAAAVVKSSYRGARLTAGLLLYVTVIYSVLQAEPRYATPFRGAELVMAVFACWVIAESIGRVRHASAPRDLPIE